MLKMDLHYNGKILLVSLSGSLNRLTSYKVNNYLVPLLFKNKIKFLVFDFENLKEIDETGIDAILNIKTAIYEQKGNISIANSNNNIDKALKKTHIKKEKKKYVIYNLIGA